MLFNIEKNLNEFNKKTKSYNLNIHSFEYEILFRLYFTIFFKTLFHENFYLSNLRQIFSLFEM